MTQPEFWIERQPPCPAIVFNFSQSLPEEIARFDSKGFYYKGEFIDDAGEVHRLLKQVLEGQLNIATTPPEPLRPIPVSERLPEPGDCAPWPGEPEATPWCWAGRHNDGGWEWAQISMLGLSANSLNWCIAGGGWSHWLPYNAIPFPEVTQ